MDLRIIVGIAFFAYGLWVLFKPDRYMDLNQKQHERLKITAPIRFMWQARARGIIYCVIAVISIVWGIVASR